jgi:ferrochelatase
MLKRKTKVVFVQLGSPKSLKISDVRSYLREFLSDRRVIDLNPYFWKIILYLFILPFRPKESAKKYARILKNGEFPLITITKAFTKKVASKITDESIEIEHAFLLSEPRVTKIWDNWENDPNPATHLKVIPMFPQFSESTTVSGIDGLGHEISKRVLVPQLSVMTHFHHSKAFIDNSVRQITHYLQLAKEQGIVVDKLLLTFHGIQKRRVVTKRDPYYLQCYETFYLIRSKLSNIDKDKVMMTFQSRFGSEEWLTPYTEATVERLIHHGDKVLAVYSPSFVADCLETIDELGFELKELAHENGGDIYFIPSLNDDDTWCKDFAHLIQTDIVGNQDQKNENYYYLEKKDYLEYESMSKKELNMKAEPMTKEAKKSLKIVFLTIFLDLLGFSIILPLFPSLAQHYLTTDGDNYFLKIIFGSIQAVANYTDGSSVFSGLVLFGGILGAIYSILQFIAAPMWGALSDRIGRRPVLLYSLIGMAFSYLIWFFSGSFTLLIIARVIDGIMGGNISTATAVVADVTTKSNRSKGMAIVGVAFALGFIFGPALGGIFSTIDLTKMYPSLVQYGVNPFSMPALVAFVLTCSNVINVYFNFKETLPVEKRGINKTERSANIFKLFKPLPYEGVNYVTLTNFLFTSAFSGMEFTLTFLAHERLNFTSMQNAYIFIYIGFIIAFVQGGVVRRKAAEVGEKKMALMGLLSVIPGLIIIANAYSVKMLYFGLLFLGIGSSMIIPCLTSLVTFYTPAEEQGRSIGIFRSMGALARVVGPLSAAILYYKFGSSAPYYVGATFLILPIILVALLPKRTKVTESESMA